jgi:hypothetical protein
LTEQLVEGTPEGDTETVLLDADWELIAKESDETRPISILQRT